MALFQRAPGLMLLRFFLEFINGQFAFRFSLGLKAFDDKGFQTDVGVFEGHAADIFQAGKKGAYDLRFTGEDTAGILFGPLCVNTGQPVGIIGNDTVHTVIE